MKSLTEWLKTRPLLKKRFETSEKVKELLVQCYECKFFIPYIQDFKPMGRCTNTEVKTITVPCEGKIERWEAQGVTIPDFKE